MDTKIEAKAVALFLYDSYEESYAAFKSFADINKHSETQARKWCDSRQNFIEARASKRQGLIAAMRCYVASHLGDEIDVPEELLCKP